MKAEPETPLGIATQLLIERALAHLTIKNGGAMQITVQELGDLSDVEFHLRLDGDTETFHISVTRR